MPIYEFKCSNCGEFFELLVTQKSGEAELKCPECQSSAFERVLSQTRYQMGAGAGTGAGKGISTQTRTCSSGSCTTIDLPGPNG